MSETNGLPTREHAATTGQRYGKVEFHRRDGVLLALSLVPAAILSFGDAGTHPLWMAVYIPLFHLSVLMLALFAIGRKRELSKTLIYVLLCDFALILSGAFNRDAFLCCANFLIIPALTSLSMMALSGVNRRFFLSAAGLWEAFCRSLRGLFEYIPLPFFSIPRSGRQSHTAFAAVLSFCVCVPVLLLVILLLSSADAVFSSRMGEFLSAVSAILEGPGLLRILSTLFIALMIFSWAFTLRMPGHEHRTADLPHPPAALPSILLPMLNLVYALFVYIQFSSLFGGAETAAMTGGYAEYARTGFFQLAAVSGINLAVLALSLWISRSAWIRCMSAMLIACTGVILFSALWRMRLYIAAYGLTVLRTMTLWGMLAIAVLLILIAVFLFRSEFRVFTVGMICILTLWVGLNAIDIDRIIAEYNVSRYLSGSLEQIDEDYLRTLSPSAEAAVSRLDAAG